MALSRKLPKKMAAFLNHFFRKDNKEHKDPIEINNTEEISFSLTDMSVSNSLSGTGYEDRVMSPKALETLPPLLEEPQPQRPSKLASTSPLLLQPLVIYTPLFKHKNKIPDVPLIPEPLPDTPALFKRENFDYLADLQKQLLDNETMTDNLRKSRKTLSSENLVKQINQAISNLDFEIKNHQDLIMNVGMVNRLFMLHAESFSPAHYSTTLTQITETLSLSIEATPITLLEQQLKNIFVSVKDKDELLHQLKHFFDAENPRRMVEDSRYAVREKSDANQTKASFKYHLDILLRCQIVFNRLKQQPDLQEALIKTVEDQLPECAKRTLKKLAWSMDDDYGAAAKKYYEQLLDHAKQLQAIAEPKPTPRRRFL